MNKDQIIIIGGGLIGLATANALLDRGEKVLVLERNTETSYNVASLPVRDVNSFTINTMNSSSDIAYILSGIARKDSPMSVSFEGITFISFLGVLDLFLTQPLKDLKKISRDIFSLAKYSKDLTQKDKEFQKNSLTMNLLMEQ